MALGAKLWGLPMPRGQRKMRAGGDLGSNDCVSGICHLNKGEQLYNMRILDNDLRGAAGVQEDKRCQPRFCPRVLSHSRPLAQARSARSGQPASKGSQTGRGRKSCEPPPRSTLAPAFERCLLTAPSLACGPSPA